MQNWLINIFSMLVSVENRRGKLKVSITELFFTHHIKVSSMYFFTPFPSIFVPSILRIILCSLFLILCMLLVSFKTAWVEVLTQVKILAWMAWVECVVQIHKILSQKSWRRLKKILFRLRSFLLYCKCTLYVIVPDICVVVFFMSISYSTWRGPEIIYSS